MLSLETRCRSRDVSRPVFCGLGLGLVGPGLGLGLVGPGLGLGLVGSGLGLVGSGLDSRPRPRPGPKHNNEDENMLFSIQHRRREYQ